MFMELATLVLTGAALTMVGIWVGRHIERRAI